MNSPELAEKTLEEDIAAAIEALPEESRPRDEMGRFAPKADTDETQAADDANVPNPAPVDEKPQDADPEPAPTDQSVEGIPDKFALPPNYAKKAIREGWADLKPEVRQELHERESEVHRQLTRFDEERNFGKALLPVVQPYVGFIKSLGAEPVQAVDYLLKTDYALRSAPIEQRRQLFLKAAADYGVDLSGGGEAFAPQTDPGIETLAQRIERLERERQSDIQQQQLREQQSLEQQIDDFASRPDRPYFDRVSPIMAALLQSGQVANLDEAYDRAVYADPETRALQFAAQQQAGQSQRLKEQAAAAEKAKAASLSVTGAPGTAEPASSPQSAGSLEDDIAAAIRAVSGRI